MRGFAALAGAVLTTLALSACAGLADDVSDPFRMDNTELLQAGFKKHEPLPPPQATFCYESLGEPMCYDHPLPGEGERLIESYPPRDYLPESSLQ
jgi:hypothetical protein